MKNNNSNNLINSQISLKEVNQLIKRNKYIIKKKLKSKICYEAKTTHKKKR